MELASHVNDIYYNTIAVAGMFTIAFVGPQALPMLLMAGLSSAAFLTGFS